MGLNAAKLYDIEVPAEYQLEGRRHARRPEVLRRRARERGLGA